MFDFRNFTPKTPMYKSKVIWDLGANGKQKLMEKITTGNNVEIVYCWLALPCRGRELVLFSFPSIFLPCLSSFIYCCSFFRDEHDPFYDKGLVNGKSSLKSGPKSTALMNQDWEKDLMEAGRY